MSSGPTPAISNAAFDACTVGALARSSAWDWEKTSKEPN